MIKSLLARKMRIFPYYVTQNRGVTNDYYYVSNNKRNIVITVTIDRNTRWTLTM